MSAGEEARDAMSGQVMNPSFGFELPHDGVDPGKAGDTIGPSSEEFLSLHIILAFWGIPILQSPVKIPADTIAIDLVIMLDLRLL